jgi:hypothetical protein
MSEGAVDLGKLFQAISGVLLLNHEELNQADPINGNHGDHMVQIFRLATQAALEKQEAGLDEAMDYGAALLRQHEQNGSARVYARGLSLLAEQFRQRGIRLSDLVAYTRRAVKESEAEKIPGGEKTARAEGGEGLRSGEILKALLNALAAWERTEVQVGEGASDAGQEEPVSEKKSSSLDMSYILGMGMSYLQAKGKGGERVDILADTVVSASPLGKVPHRARSGKLVFTTLLRALLDSTP